VLVKKGLSGNMKNKINDTNKLVDTLTVILADIVLNDATWQPFGYNKRPISNILIKKISPSKHELVNYITKELITIGIIDIISIMNKQNYSQEFKLLITIGILDRLLTSLEYLLKPYTFIKDIKTAYDDYFNDNTDKHSHEIFILRAKNRLSKTNFAKLLFGAIKFFEPVLTIKHRDTIILNSKSITKLVDDQINDQGIMEQLDVKSDKNELVKLSEYLANELITS
jgi:hypothetical protein